MCVDQCAICGHSIYSGDEVIRSEMKVAHYECAEASEDPEWQEE